MKLRSLGALVAAASISLSLAAPAGAATTAPPQCVEELFYTYIREPEPWTPMRCIDRDSSRASTDSRPLDELLGPIPCVAYSAVRVATGESNEISCI